MTDVYNQNYAYTECLMFNSLHSLSLSKSVLYIYKYIIPVDYFNFKSFHNV